MAERHSERDRVTHDWYVEPEWCVKALFNHRPLSSGLHDPCCGGGTIPRYAWICGKKATGADIVKRGPFPVQDFLTDTAVYPAIVTNPPYSIAQDIIEHALKHVQPGGLVAALVQAKFLFSQKRHSLFVRPEMDHVIVLSRRPSMPPGEALAEHGEAIRGGGSIDFLWAVWQSARESIIPPTIHWVL